MERNILITFLASFLIWIMVGGLIYLWIFKKKINFWYLFYIFTLWAACFVITEIIKRLTQIPRPFFVEGGLPLTITIPTDPSFPSAHASGAFAIATGVRRLDRRLFFLYFIFAFLVSWGRMLSRVHYFLDVFFGAFLGVGVVLILEKIGLERFLKKLLSS